MTGMAIDENRRVREDRSEMSTPEWTGDTFASWGLLLEIYDNTPVNL